MKMPQLSTISKSFKKGPCHKRKWVALIAAFLFCVLVISHPAPAEIFDHYQVKAVFLFNLTHFIHWPASEPSIKDQPFTITVFGRDRLHAYLDKVVRGESINNRKVVVRRSQSLADLDQRPGDLIFISESQMSLWPQIREIARSHRILTVSDVEGFAHRSGMVNLVTIGRNIRIEINIDETKRNGFDVSAKLLKLARIVKSGKDDR